ncbi:Endonuclease/Exonuclease/phosphatase family protein [Ralstonia sp. 25mfcol4.1]|uniref:endonuclease/exonuclease/phosphatase family protein n=1 Tax=Burkholderiaceae TaxID=119060 RepID=UPI00087E5BFF|nr:endonuclease/exonuclease/phosphatase family protein [Ralstonia sp. 25mfcol4.1]SDP39959.1 Endonuclease/Exonuclease/phosphatase family protein [Ralstonia sp. 25mfcol4.1]
MTHYDFLADIADTHARARTIEGLTRLRQALANQIPARTATDTLLLATWNIREFDSGKYGYRSEESYLYIAEVLSRFDLIAIQEVRDGLYPLQRLQRMLGPWWGYLVTDVTLGTSGNAERMAYLYDRRKVRFTGLAAELVLPRAGRAGPAPVQLARSPYLAGFQAGWAYLTLATVHIYYGTGKPDDARRLAEITAFSQTVAKAAGKLSAAPQPAPGVKADPGNLILLGDFNIFNRRDVTMEAITRAGFVVPEPLQSVPGSNVDKNRHYDQIAYFRRLSRMAPTGRAGVFDVYEHVYRLADADAYASERRTRPGRSFKDWRTYRISDHLPMWIEFGIDDADAWLAGLGG